MTRREQMICGLLEGGRVMEWISVKDRLPEPYVIVLCCTNKGYVDTDSFGRYSKVFLKCDDMEGKVGQVIAWMPLPEPPREEKR